MDQTMIIHRRAEHFYETVERAFAFLTDPYHFEIVERDHARGEIWLDYRSAASVVVHVDFELIGGIDVTLRLERSFRGSIGANVRDLLPAEVADALRKEPMANYDDEVVVRVVAAYAAVLHRYGDRYLEADLQAWRDLAIRQHRS